MDEIIKNSEYITDITGYASDGSGVCRINGRAVFVKNTLEGERWRIKIVKVSKTAVYAIGSELLIASPERQTPECPYFSKCGGCSLMHMSYKEELRYKLARVNDCLRRIGGLDFKIDSIQGAENTSGYRNKGIYAVKNEDGQITSGFYRRRSHDITSVQCCIIQTKLSNAVSEAVCCWMSEYGVSAYDENSHSGIVRHIFTRCSFNYKQAQACIVCTSMPGHMDELIGSLRSISPSLSSIVLCINKSTGNTVLSGKFITVWGDTSIDESLCGLDFKLSPSSFFQINPAQAEYLYSLACKYASPARNASVIDLYCGTGTISLCLAKKAKLVIGAEIVQSAVDDAIANCRRNSIDNARFICADAGKAAEQLANEGIQPDALVIDPPRKGLDAPVIDAILKMSPRRIVYVSCDPATMARDIALLKDYDVISGEAVDMFPRCSHVETCVLLSKLNVEHHIEIDLNLDEMDLTSAESAATYEEIKAHILETSGLKVSSLYIAQVKRKYGAIRRENYNLAKSDNSIQPQCPPEKEQMIKSALEHFSMI